MSRCDHCPLGGGDLACHGESAPTLCARAAADPSFARALANNVRVESRPKAEATGLPATWTRTPGKLRVGLACPALFHGGAESWQLALARHLDPARVDLAGCAVAWGRDSAAPALVDRFAELMPVAFGDGQVAELAARCDVLVEWAIPNIGAILDGLGDAPRAKVVAVSHSPGESPWAMEVYRDPRGIDRFVAVSELALPPIPESHRSGAAVIWNAVDPVRLEARRSRAAMRTAWNVPAGAHVVGYLGRLAEEKDPGAMARLVPHLPDDAHVVMVGQVHGDAGEAATLEHPRFHRPGPDPDAGSVLAAFDCLVVPSDYESFGLTIGEGLWCGVPTISTEVGIARLAPGLTRPIPIRASGQELAAAVLADREDADGRWARTLRAQAWAREHLDPARFGREWTDLICEMTRPAVSSLATPPPATVADFTPAQCRAAETCPHRQIPGCGCSGMECGPGGKRPGERLPSILPCLECVAEAAGRSPN